MAVVKVIRETPEERVKYLDSRILKAQKLASARFQKLSQANKAIAEDWVYGNLVDYQREATRKRDNMRDEIYNTALEVIVG